jgi:hypothetical protein
MGPSDRPLRGHRAPSLIFLGFAQTPNSLREFLVPQFNRIEVLAFCLGGTRTEACNPTEQTWPFGYGGAITITRLEPLDI